MPDIIDEKRKDRRLEDFNEITLSVIPGEKNLPEEKIFYNYSEDISESGAKIHASSILPVGALIRVEMKLKNLHQNITTPGKVKWIKAIFSDGSCDAGVEFVNTPAKAMKKLDNYISWVGMLHTV